MMSNETREPLFRRRKPEHFWYWFGLYVCCKAALLTFTMLAPDVALDRPVPPFPGYLPAILFLHAILSVCLEFPVLGALYFIYYPTPELREFTQAFRRYRLVFWLAVAVILAAGMMLFNALVRSDSFVEFLTNRIGPAATIMLALALLLAVNYSPLLLVAVLRLNKRRRKRHESGHSRGTLL